MTAIRTPLHVQLKRARIARGMTIPSLARKTRYKIRIDPIECGKEPILAEELGGILRALNCYCIIGGPGGAYVVERNQDVRR